MVTLHQSNESHMKLEWHISTVGGREKTNKQTKKLATKNFVSKEFILHT